MTSGLIKAGFLGLAARGRMSVAATRVRPATDTERLELPMPPQTIVSRRVNQHTALPMPWRFWAKVKFDGLISEHRPDLGPCWLWTGRKTDRGYAAFGDNIRAHRYAYKFCVGDIPEGLEPDHLCRTRHCVEPFHLELVTHRENTLRGEATPAVNARKTHCLAGHPFDETNTGRQTNGGRRCRTCQRNRQAIQDMKSKRSHHARR